MTEKEWDSIWMKCMSREGVAEKARQEITLLNEENERLQCELSYEVKE